MRILLDSGAAISVVRNDALSDNCRRMMTMTPKTAVGANGLPLKVMGQVAMKVSLDTFQAIQTFVVVQDLTFECILGADFLSCNKAFMNFRNNSLHLGNNTSITVPTGQNLGIQVSDTIHSIPVHALEDMEIPGRSVRLVIATLQEGSYGEEFAEGLIEPVASLPKHLCVARSLGRVSFRGSILVQMMNVSPAVVNVYKGTQLGQFVPQRNITLMESDIAAVSSSGRRESTKFNLSSAEITDSEKHELRNLLHEKVG